ncbi:hypothetical protein EHQ59_17050 [Leptospira kemamanensis]|uniref:Uncharacterized protein n=1 Tax=Leptospira kemamanensis TaxID=2484942 RepID=A0A4R9JKI4_9LEPT|nr:hypothetical protein [Leptospira kemamanensis]TGL46744.1 hypothetical protein EHQ59_17050 [Leptospira kemamanensis]
MKSLFLYLVAICSLFSVSLFASNKSIDCGRAKKGFFYYEASPDMFIIIERNTNFQKQHRLYETFYKEESITWVDSCSYILKTTEVKDPFLGNEIGAESEIRILSVTQEYYEYKSKENGEWKEVERIYFLKDLTKMIEKQKKYNQID